MMPTMKRPPDESEDTNLGDSPATPEAPAPSSETDVVVTAFWSGVAVAMSVVLLYVVRAAPTTYLLDSSELVATTVALGISHPPGHPAFHLGAYPWTLLPLGNAAFRIHLFVALTSAITLGLLPAVAARLGWLRTRSEVGAAALVAFALAFTPAFAQQSIRAEVYALNALFIAVASVAVLWRRTAPSLRHVGVAASVLGVGLLNHHYLIVFAVPAFALALALAPLPPRARFVGLGRALAAGVLPLAGYGYLLARGAAQPPASWGWPTSASETWWIVSAQAFQKTAARATSMDVGAGAANVAWVVAEQLTAVGAVTAIVGLLIAVRRSRWVGVFLIVAIALNLLTQVLFDFDPMNPDVLGYFMPTVWMLGLGLTAALTGWSLPGALARGSEVIRIVYASTLAAAIALSAVAGDRTVKLSGDWGSELLRDEAFSGLRPDSLWVTSYYETGFNTWYAQAVEDRRPDVDHLHQAFLTYPFYRVMLSPSARAVLTDSDGTGDGGTLLDLEALVERSRHSDVRIEAELLVGPDIATRSLPTRLYLTLLPDPLPEGEFPADLNDALLDHTRAAHRRFGAAPETQTARNLLWSSFNLATQMCTAGRTSTCLSLIDEALNWAPHDPDLLSFRASILRDAGSAPKAPP